ncbi:MAG: Stp1/IreP family PP2C-type Ser/Thr phosphatase [Clostridia bacterium]|nr:Stp1/IreP family PP2C-type Ser/Thr phosphatase [Clostridia bacterium]
MKISAGTDVGMIRSGNQDSYAIGELEGGAWAVVCDGMGGHAAGNVASEMAVEKISTCIKSNFRQGMSVASIKNVLESAIVTANADIYDKAQKNQELEGMGTTAVVSVCLGNKCVIAHVGDSRCYYVSGNTITQITKDHSLVQEMIDAGLITPEEAECHPRKNIITRALGGCYDDVEVDFNDLVISEGDMIVLCTDGLTNHVDENTILENISGDDIHNFADRLIRIANENGGRDNITAVVMRN